MMLGVLIDMSQAILELNPLNRGSSSISTLSKEAKDVPKSIVYVQNSLSFTANPLRNLPPISSFG